MTPSDSVITMLRAAPRSERRRMLEQVVVAELRQVLQMPATEHLPLDESVFGLGVTSLGAVDLKERLEARLDCAIDADVLFNHPTVGHLVDYLAEGTLRELFTGTAAATGAAEPVASPGRPAGAREAAAKELMDDLLKRSDGS